LIDWIYLSDSLTETISNKNVEMFSVWSREFNSRLAVNGNKFVITLPISDILNIQSIKYTKIGNWIEISGTMEQPKVSSIENIDGLSNRAKPQGFNKPRHGCFGCRADQGKEETGTEAKAKARTEQLF
jgi:hypothetical protein